MALGSPASGEVVPVSPSPVSGGVVVAATVYAGIPANLYSGECVEACIDTTVDTYERVIILHAGGRNGVCEGGGSSYQANSTVWPTLVT